jgi:nicotinamidase/pyrazinamidase
MRDVALLVIDPQNDFCSPSGALSVAGADRDMDRLAGLLEAHGEAISRVHVTLDGHHLLDVSHPAWWRDAEGRPPPPFTAIGPAELRGGRWRTADPAEGPRALAYLEALEAGGRYPHVVWPPHCLIGEEGQAVWPRLAGALRGWAGARRARVDFVHKGANPWTEHFSAVRAEVPDAADPGTGSNRALVAALAAAELVLVAGEARSHCVASTVRDLAASFTDPRAVERLVLLEDATSDVPGFEAQGARFVEELAARGMRLATTATAPALLGRAGR